MFTATRPNYVPISIRTHFQSIFAEDPTTSLHVVEFQGANVTQFFNFDLLNDTEGTIGTSFTAPLIQPAGNG
jgi:hypothetical protein